MRQMIGPLQWTPAQWRERLAEAERKLEDVRKKEAARKCITEDGEHAFDDGRCMICGLDLEYTGGDPHAPLV